MRDALFAVCANGVVGPFVEFGVLTKTTNDAAGTLGCDVGALASSLDFVLDGSPVVVVTGGAFRVDLDRFAVVAGGTHVHHVRADEVRAATGQSFGGVSPVGGRKRYPCSSTSLSPRRTAWGRPAVRHTQFLRRPSTT